MSSDISRVDQLCDAWLDRSESERPQYAQLFRHLVQNLALVRGSRFEVRQAKLAVVHEVVDERSASATKTELVKASTFLKRYRALLLVPPPSRHDTLRASDFHLQAFTRRLQEEKPTPELPHGLVEWAATRAATLLSVQDLFVHRLISGLELVDVYNDGSVRNCMTGKTRAASVLANNPEVVSVVTVHNLEGVLVGRALLWRTLEGARLLDKVYPDDMGAHIRYLHAIAEKEGWVYRLASTAKALKERAELLAQHGLREYAGENGIGSGAVLLSVEQGTFFSARLDVSSKTRIRWPYFDTFRWGSGVDSSELNHVVVGTACGEGTGMTHHFSHRLQTNSTGTHFLTYWEPLRAHVPVINVLAHSYSGYAVNYNMDRDYVYTVLLLL
eukprot:gene15625-18526_t